MFMNRRNFFLVLRQLATSKAKQKFATPISRRDDLLHVAIYRPERNRRKIKEIKIIFKELCYSFQIMYIDRHDRLH